MDLKNNTNRDLLFEIISSFRKGKYLSVINLIHSINGTGSILYRYYLLSSYSKLRDVYGLIDVATNFFTQEYNINSSSKIMEAFLKNETLKRMIEVHYYAISNINFLEKLNLIEDFIIKHSGLFISLEMLSSEQLRLLSNIINILGDLQRIYYNNKRKTYICYKFANKLFSENVYALINFADLAFEIRHYELAFECLSKANDLIFHSSKERLVVYNPYADTNEFINPEVLKIFKKLCLFLGYKWG
ncbi:MAG: hypothetical protein QXS69_02710 [Candidatus Aenigmatarchaeota archaeon]